MEKEPVPKQEKKKTWIGVLVVVIVIVLVGSFIGLDHSKLFPSTTTSTSQVLYVYPGVSGSNNSNHLLGGCVVAVANNGSTNAASEQLVAYLLIPSIQKSFEINTGFIPVDQSSYNATPSSSVPSIYSASSPTVSVTYYTSMSAADESYVNGVISNFETAYPNIHVSTSFVTATSIVSAVQTAEASKNVGNIVMTIDNLDVGTLFYEGDLLNLTSVTPAITADAGVLSSISQLNNYETNVFGGIYFLTQLVNIPLVWMDWTAMTGAGITTAPSNYTQLFNDAKTLYDHYGVGEVNFQGHGGASTATELYQWMVQFGGNPMVFNSTGDIHAMEYLYNLSPYLSPDYSTSYWATYTGLASNSYTMMYYQWPGSVNLTALSMKPYNSTDSALNASLAAIKGGVFIRDPVVWIDQWQIYMDSAWTDIVVDHSTTSYSSIPSILSSENTAMYNYLYNTTGPANLYGPAVAHEYEKGYFQPVSV
ncbi:MAG: ABC transporter substrate-binding protein [Candidatus Thermoplasmatota archaeon]|nr:ABC transporter substrate-binding protein [Candidatus Thermoplasmatota archaeon]